MKPSLNHIGIAVSDLALMRELFSLLGLSAGHIQAVPAQGVKAHFLELSAASAVNAAAVGAKAAPPPHLELLEVMDPGGTVAKFLEKRGPGVHHLAFEFEQHELEPLCDRLRQAGYRLTYDKPRRGAKEMLINFIHPSSAGGILIELMAKGYESDSPH